MKLFLETGDIARRLGVVPATVRGLVRRGDLRPTARTPRGTRLFRAKDVEALRQARQARASSGPVQ